MQTKALLSSCTCRTCRTSITIIFVIHYRVEVGRKDLQLEDTNRFVIFNQPAWAWREVWCGLHCLVDPAVGKHAWVVYAAWPLETMSVLTIHLNIQRVAVFFCSNSQETAVRVALSYQCVSHRLQHPVLPHKVANKVIHCLFGYRERYVLYGPRHTVTALHMHWTVSRMAGPCQSKHMLSLSQPTFVAKTMKCYCNFYRSSGNILVEIIRN